MHRENSLIADNIVVLRQGLNLLGRLDSRLFSAPGPHRGWGGVGSHLRHCLDFYTCFLKGIPANRIDYNARERDERVATNCAAAAERVREITRALEALSSHARGTAVSVRAEGAGGPADPDSWSRSTLARELQFLLSHTVHHYALIALMLRLQDFEPADDFGVAPSTLDHWRKAS
jgi:uncharacterized damage-inducible protein DinB